MRAFSLLAVLLAAGSLWAAPSPTREDYQKKADEAPWEWSETRATAADCAKRLPRGYRAEIEPQDEEPLGSIRILKDGAVAHVFRGHAYTVFAIREGILYYARFRPIGSGGVVVAYDLRTKKQLWQTRLKALGSVFHSEYRNFLNLDLDKDAVRIRGNECLGRYIEFLDLRTGKTVGHKVYPEE